MSLFTEALEDLLDKTNLFSRREWAKVLSTKEAIITQWLAEEVLPRAHHLAMIYTVLENSSDIPKEPLNKFKMMAEMPAREVSKFGKRMLPTVWEYMFRPIFSELSSKLAKLSPEDQEKLLEEIYRS